jgi:hypothetical protein
MKAFCVIALAVVPFATAGTAHAATPAAATKRISACLKNSAGAVKVKARHGTGGVAYFKAASAPSGMIPWAVGAAEPAERYLKWNYLTSHGQVVGTATISTGLSKRQRRASRRCMALVERN